MFDEIFKSIHLISNQNIQQVDATKCDAAVVSYVDNIDWYKYRVLYQGNEYEAFAVGGQIYQINQPVVIMFPEKTSTLPIYILSSLNQRYFNNGISIETDPQNPGQSEHVDFYYGTGSLDFKSMYLDSNQNFVINAPLTNLSIAYDATQDTFGNIQTTNSGLLKLYYNNNDYVSLKTIQYSANLTYSELNLDSTFSLNNLSDSTTGSNSIYFYYGPDRNGDATTKIYADGFGALNTLSNLVSGTLTLKGDPGVNGGTALFNYGTYSDLSPYESAVSGLTLTSTSLEADPITGTLQTNGALATQSNHILTKQYTDINPINFFVDGNTIGVTLGHGIKINAGTNITLTSGINGITISSTGGGGSGTSYTAGTGLTLNGVTFSTVQDIATSATPSFKGLSFTNVAGYTSNSLGFKYYNSIIGQQEPTPLFTRYNYDNDKVNLVMNWNDYQITGTSYTSVFLDQTGGNVDTIDATTLFIQGKDVATEEYVNNKFNTSQFKKSVYVATQNSYSLDNYYNNNSIFLNYPIDSEATLYGYTSGQYIALFSDDVSAIDEISISGFTPYYYGTPTRVLFKNMQNSQHNGIYDYAGFSEIDPVNYPGYNYYVFFRSQDADNTPSGEVTKDMFCFVEKGTQNINTAWVLTTDNPITLSSTELAFQKAIDIPAYGAGNGITISSGNTISVILNSGTGITVSSSTNGLTVSLLQNGITINGIAVTLGNSYTSSVSNGITLLSNSLQIDTTSSVTFSNINITNSITVTTIKSTNEQTSNFTTTNLNATTLIGSNATITNINSTSITTTNLNSSIFISTSLTSTNINNTNLTTSNINSTTLINTNATITNLNTGAITSTSTVNATKFIGSGASLTNIPNSSLSNSGITINGIAINLGDTKTLINAGNNISFTTGTSGITVNAIYYAGAGITISGPTISVKINVGNGLTLTSSIAGGITITPNLNVGTGITTSSSASGLTIATVQDISTTASPTFKQVNITNPTASASGFIGDGGNTAFEFGSGSYDIAITANGGVGIINAYGDLRIGAYTNIASATRRDYVNQGSYIKAGNGITTVSSINGITISPNLNVGTGITTQSSTSGLTISAIVPTSYTIPISSMFITASVLGTTYSSYTTANYAGSSNMSTYQFIFRSSMVPSGMTTSFEYIFSAAANTSSIILQKLNGVTIAAGTTWQYITSTQVQTTSTVGIFLTTSAVSLVDGGIYRLAHYNTAGSNTQLAGLRLIIS